MKDVDITILMLKKRDESIDNFERMLKYHKSEMKSIRAILKFLKDERRRLHSCYMREVKKDE